MAGLEGTRLGAYELIERVGSGGMAEVYRARQLSAFGRDVALKVIDLHYAQDQTFRARFLREAQAVSRLAHPNILPLIEFGEEGQTLYLVMPFIREGTLRDLLKRRNGPLPVEQAIPLFTQLCNATQYAHDAGIVHRDIKPQNVLLQGYTHVLLADFGIARDRHDNRMTGTGAGLGTIEYMAPEQAMGQGNARSDIYSLGVVLYHMLTGALPYSGASPLQVLLKQANDPLPDPRAHNPTLSPRLEQALQIALLKDPQRRFESAAAFSYVVNPASADAAQVSSQSTQPLIPHPAGGPVIGAPPTSAPPAAGIQPAGRVEAMPGRPPVPPAMMPPPAAGGWGNQAPNRPDWHDAPTWANQRDPRLPNAEGNGLPPAGGGGPPDRGGLPPGGGGPPDDGERQSHRRRSLLIALIAALVLLILASSAAYGYFGLGWLSPGGASSGAQQVTPSPTSPPTDTPILIPTYPPPPSPTYPPPLSPSPTSPEPSPSPTGEPASPTPEPSQTPSAEPSPGSTASPEPSPSASPTTGPSPSPGAGDSPTPAPTGGP